MLTSSCSDCSRVAAVRADSATATTEAELRKVIVNSVAVPGVIALVDSNSGTAEPTLDWIWPDSVNETTYCCGIDVGCSCSRVAVGRAASAAAAAEATVND